MAIDQNTTNLGVTAKGYNSTFWGVEGGRITVSILIRVVVTHVTHR